MQYEGKPNHPVPSNRYPIFIDAFEKFVTRQQHAIREAEKMQRPYMIVRDAFEAAKLPNDVSIALRANLIDVDIVLLSADRLSSFFPIVRAIGDGLKTHGLHFDGVPGTEKMAWNPKLRFFWHLRTFSCVMIWLHMPEGGVAGCPVAWQEKQSIERVCLYSPEDGEVYQNG